MRCTLWLSLAWTVCACGAADGPAAVSVTDGAPSADGGSDALPGALPDAGASVGDAAPAVCPTAEDPAEGLVATAVGSFQGVSEGAGFTFLGLPYAAPPVGDLRFRPPAPAPCPPAPLPADVFKAVCPQLDKSGALIGAEDCLGLNVWTPGPLSGAPSRPVAVFIPGGGQIQGSGGERLVGGALLYDGRRLAEAGEVVVVTFNYRLGPLGFLSLPALDEAPSPSLNLGTQDQLAALRWVHDHIGAFGGDPDRVLLFGESAGAVNVCALLVTPQSAGLFHAALMQSGGCGISAKDRVLAAHAARVDAGPCGAALDRLGCLRALPLADLFAALPPDIGALFSPSVGATDAKFQPVVDGAVIPAPPLEAIAAGRHHAVPLIVGTNREELAASPGFEVSSAADFEARIRRAFSPLDPGLPDRLLAAYPLADYADPRAALVAVFSDMRFVCPNRWVLRAAARGQTQPVYRYEFARRLVTPRRTLPASHGVELPYVFGSLNNFPGFQPPAADVALSEAMIRYWTRFAATGDPNGEPDPAWPPFDGAQGEAHLILDMPLAPGADLRAAQCDLWDEVSAGLGLLPPGAR